MLIQGNKRFLYAEECALCWFRQNVSEKKKSRTALNFAASDSSGSIVFVLLGMANMYGSEHMIFESYIAIGAIGMVVMMAMAFALDIFSEDTVQ